MVQPGFEKRGYEDDSDDPQGGFRGQTEPEGTVGKNIGVDESDSDIEEEVEEMPCDQGKGCRVRGA